MHDNNAILDLYPQYDKVYGPYTSKDGRKRIVLKKTGCRDGVSTTISYPKALKEIQDGRRLSENETVDHKDRDFANNDPENLNVLDRQIHASLDSVRVQVDPVNCPTCGTSFIPNKNQIKSRSSDKAGPFCSRSCVGKYTIDLKNGSDKMLRTPVTKTYFRIDK